jgi:hypothetical protein
LILFLLPHLAPLNPHPLPGLGLALVILGFFLLVAAITLLVTAIGILLSVTVPRISLRVLQGVVVSLPPLLGVTRSPLRLPLGLSADAVFV